MQGTWHKSRLQLILIIFFPIRHSCSIVTLKKGLDKALKIIFIKFQPVSTALFIILCKEMVTTHKALSCTSKDNVQKAFVQVF